MGAETVELYVTTDSVELGDILDNNGKYVVDRGESEFRGSVWYGRYKLRVRDLSMEEGRQIQERYRLEFNPMAFVWDIPFQSSSEIVRKLVKKQLWVTTVPNGSRGKVKSFFPDKHGDVIQK